MKRIKAALAAFALCAIWLAVPAAARAAGFPDAVALLRKVEANQVYGSIAYEGSMEIRSGGKTHVKTMKAWSVGSGKALIEFTNPEDRGVRMLKLDRNLWVYFPSERDTVKISGYMLSQGMMGSDLSYEEAMEPDSLLEAYDAVWLRMETVGGREAHVLELSSKTGRTSYEKRILWIDAERFVTLKSEMYAKSGKLIKETESLEVVKTGGRWFPSKVLMRDKLKKDSETVFAMLSLTLDAKIDESMFSLKALTK